MPADPARDPRVDPKPGDVVRMWFRPPHDPWYRTVLERRGNAVFYESSTKPGERLVDDIGHWRLIRWSNQAEVIHAAD